MQPVFGSPYTKLSINATKSKNEHNKQTGQLVRWLTRRNMNNH